MAPFAVAPRLMSTVYTVFLGTYSFWMDNLLSLDIVGRVLDLSQSNVPYNLLGLSGRWDEKRDGGNVRRGGTRNWDCYAK